MTISAATAKSAIVTIRGTYTAHTFTPVSIEAPDGMHITGPSLYALSATVDSLIFRLNGETSCDGTWEIQITMKRKDLPGPSENIQKPNKKK
jgi:hypothetical protein